MSGGSNLSLQQGTEVGVGHDEYNFMLPDGEIEVHMAQHASIQTYDEGQITRWPL